MKTKFNIRNLINSLKLAELALISIAVMLNGCPSTPNNVSMAPTNGVCVQSSQYKLPPPSAIVNNPTTAPYCLAVTITNNNSGNNANNIQIIGNGLNLSYKANGQSFSSIMYDPYAAGVNISGSLQKLGNITLYDPQNCATTQAGNVITLNYNGGKCTFYLQLTGESFPVGSYPVNLTYNYTNGNQNYLTSLAVSQKVNLYGGSTQGLYLDTNNSWQNTSIVPNQSINSIINDQYGNIYMAVNNQVWLFNGTTASQIGANFLSVVNSLAIDQNYNNYNIYAGTQNNGIYIMPKGANSWSQFSDTRNQITNSSSIIGLKASEGYPLQNTLYALTNNSAYQCQLLNVSNVQSCQFNLLTNGTMPTSFNNNALAINPNNNLFTGNNASAYTYVSTWSPFTFTPAITGQVFGVAFMMANTLPNPQFLFLGETSNSTTEASVYKCALSGSNCTPLVGSSNNIINGNVKTVTTDGANNIYVGGNSLTSQDFSLSGTYAAAYFTTLWLPITGSINGSLQTLKVSSMLSK